MELMPHLLEQMEQMVRMACILTQMDFSWLGMGKMEQMVYMEPVVVAVVVVDPMEGHCLEIMVPVLVVEVAVKVDKVVLVLLLVGVVEAPLEFISLITVQEEF
jgi:hypothetical protein